MIDLRALNAAECRAIIDAARARLAEIAGKPLCLEAHGEVYQERPGYGAVLVQKWATDAHASVDWYPTESAAMAALHDLAEEHGRVVSGSYVDLTVTGCCPSYAQVRAS